MYVQLKVMVFLLIDSMMALIDIFFFFFLIYWKKNYWIRIYSYFGKFVNGEREV